MILIRKYYLVFVPLGLLYLAINGFGSSQTLCLSNFLFNIECWGCGLGRATIELLNGNLSNALELNNSIIIVMILLLYTWLNNIIKKINIRR